MRTTEAQRRAMKNYKKSHRLQINEQNRLRVNNYSIPVKTYSFDRDFLNHIPYLTKPEDLQLKEKIYEVLFSLKLTKYQRQILKLKIDGLTQLEISEKLQNNQTSILKAINGNWDHVRDVSCKLGGIFKKFVKYYIEDKTLDALIETLPPTHFFKTIWEKFVISTAPWMCGKWCSKQHLRDENNRLLKIINELQTDRDRIKSEAIDVCI